MPTCSGTDVYSSKNRYINPGITKPRCGHSCNRGTFRISLYTELRIASFRSSVGLICIQYRHCRSHFDGMKK